METRLERSDEQLVADYRGGDDVAFAELVRRNLPIVHRFALRYAATDEAEDIAQEAFVRAWKNLGTFDESKRFRPWLFEIAKNAALDRLKKKAPTAFSELATNDDDARAEFMEGIADDALPQDAVVDAGFAATQLAYALDTLPTNQRDVVRLHYTDELTFREIADKLGSTLNTVKSWHLRALRALRNRIDE